MLLYILVGALLIQRFFRQQKMVQIQAQLDYFMTSFAHNLIETVLCNDWKNIPIHDEYIEHLLVTFATTYGRIHRYFTQPLKKLTFIGGKPPYNPL